MVWAWQGYKTHRIGDTYFIEKANNPHLSIIINNKNENNEICHIQLFDNSWDEFVRCIGEIDEFIRKEKEKRRADMQKKPESPQTI